MAFPIHSINGIATITIMYFEAFPITKKVTSTWNKGNNHGVSLNSIYGNNSFLTILHIVWSALFPFLEVFRNH